MNRYLEMRIKSGSPSDRLIMLYDYLIDQAEISLEFLEKENISENTVKASKAGARCLNALAELTSSLRAKEYPELGSQLFRLYRFFNREIAEALATHDPERIRLILPLMNRLRIAWLKAQQQQSNASLMSVAAA